MRLKLLLDEPRIGKIYELTIGEPDLSMDDERIQWMLRGVDIYQGEELARAISIRPSTNQKNSNSVALDLPREPKRKFQLTKDEGHARDEEGEEHARALKRQKDAECGDDHEQADLPIPVPETQGKAENQSEEPRTPLSKKKQKRQVKGITKVLLEIQEGRNRVIRRMCSRVRLPLVHLHRLRIGNIDLEQLGLEGRIGALHACDPCR